MQILRPERTGTQDDSVAMVNRNDLRIEFLQSAAKNLGSSLGLVKTNCGGSSLAALTQNDSMSTPTVILSAFAVILSPSLSF
jgi:hypothetical protein